MTDDGFSLASSLVTFTKNFLACELLSPRSVWYICLRGK